MDKLLRAQNSNKKTQSSGADYGATVFADKGIEVSKETMESPVGGSFQYPFKSHQEGWVHQTGVRLRPKSQSKTCPPLEGEGT